MVPYSIESSKIVADSLAHLQQLSLVDLQGERYTMLPLTLTYARSQIAAYPDFEVKARKR